jgi:hypothetical protein
MRANRTDWRSRRSTHRRFLASSVGDFPMIAVFLAAVTYLYLAFRV